VPSWALGRREGRRLRASYEKVVYMCETTMISTYKAVKIAIFLYRQQYALGVR
jgi:hypothetical protein